MALTQRNRKFCKFYVQHSEYFGNGTHAYGQAYGIDIRTPAKYAIAANGAYRLLKNDEILRYINKLLGEMALNDVFVDKQMAFIITQNANLPTKLGGIREYNKLKKRVVNRHIHTGDEEGGPIVLHETVTYENAPKKKSRGKK